jgi:penicillin-binding protein 1A
MMMAVASDIPLIENKQEYKNVGNNSYLYDDHWRPIGIFAAPNPEVIDQWKDISPSCPPARAPRCASPVIHAVLAVEDKRFWSDPGVDTRGIIRALVSDVGGGQTQGASTITEQFVKNALQQQSNRTVFEKLREAALAFHLTRKWKPTKILTEYLNSVYFGNGAYGIESAARVYFGKALGYDPSAPSDGATSTCGDRKVTHLPACASKLNYWQAALLAGLIANPSAWDPIANPHDARARRNLVLKDMLEQHYITQPQYATGIREPLPTQNDLLRPSEPPTAPYFTSWLRPQILSAVGYRPNETPQQQEAAQYRAYYGGLKIRTSLDLKMQQAADQSISQILPYGGPDSAVASLVTIDNYSGEVRAMVGGPIVGGQENYGKYPFNLATEAQRQPGSSFKPFTLAVALESGFGPDSVLLSAPADFIVPNSGGKEIFHVRNFGNTYSGPITLQQATDYSDNSVYSRLGIEGLGPKGTKRIARMATNAGIRTPVSHNYAMILGGLKVGVSPLDMAHAYETFADGGRRAYNPVLGSPDQGPTGIAEIQYSNRVVKDTPSFRRVMPTPIAEEVHNMLEGVVQSGTGTAAAISGTDVVGKTGTTTNYADAWFVGWTPQLTTAVWVGFPNKLVSMSTLFNGGPVEGGTYPAIIWHEFMTQALAILASEHPGNRNTSTTSTTSTTDTGSSPTGSSGGGPSLPTPPSSGGSGTAGTGTGGGGGGGAGGGGGGGATGGGGGGATGGGGGATGGGGGGGTAGGGATGGGGGGGTTGGGGGTTGGGGSQSGGAGIGSGH